MEAIQFGNIGVCVEDFTKESLYEFLESHYLGELLDSHYFKDSSKCTQNMYLQAFFLFPDSSNDDEDSSKLRLEYVKALLNK